MTGKAQHRVPKLRTSPGAGSPQSAVAASTPSTLTALWGSAIFVIAAAAISVLCSGSSGCGASSDVDLPVLGSVPDFSLVERSGRTVRAADFRGHIWVADFIFTRCASICPGLSARMAVLQNTLRREEASRGEVSNAPASSTARRLDASDVVLLVSFTVDPEHDTAEVLRLYAERFRADPDRWRFLTGPRAAIHKLVTDGFRLGIGEAPPGNNRENTSVPIIHSDRFVLVDRELHIRGYYPGLEEEGVGELMRQIRRLRQETSLR
jgi:cytochrome oxidase Cu insertion factor (SCO1/SenC/PrrC family)